MHLNVPAVSSDRDFMVDANYISKFIDNYALCGRILLEFSDVVVKDDLYRRFSKTDRKKIDGCLQKLEKNESLINYVDFNNTYRPSPGVAEIIQKINAEKRKKEPYVPRKPFISWW